MNDRFLPTIRGLTARKLTDNGWSQSAIAAVLDVSQGMVSKYLGRDLPMAPFAEIEQLAAEAADLIGHGADKVALTGLICKWCFSFKEKGKLCEHHRIRSCSVCMNLRSEEGIGDRLRVLEDIEQAIQHLEGADAEYLSPQVRINIARALPKAESSMDVAAVPGRLIPLTKGFRTLAPPEFGASRHLSSLLLAVMDRDPEIRAVMNIRYGEDMDAVLSKGNRGGEEDAVGVGKRNGDRDGARKKGGSEAEKGGETLYENRGGPEDGDCGGAGNAKGGRTKSPRIMYLDRTVFPDITEFLHSDQWDQEEIVVDTGDFGIEPCTYVFGRSAVRIVDRVLGLFPLAVESDRDGGR